MKFKRKKLIETHKVAVVAQLKFIPQNYRKKQFFL